MEVYRYKLSIAREKKTSIWLEYQQYSMVPSTPLPSIPYLPALGAIIPIIKWSLQTLSFKLTLALCITRTFASSSYPLLHAQWRADQPSYNNIEGQTETEEGRHWGSITIRWWHVYSYEQFDCPWLFMHKGSWRGEEGGVIGQYGEGQAGGRRGEEGACIIIAKEDGHW